MYEDSDPQAFLAAMKGAPPYLRRQSLVALGKLRDGRALVPLLTATTDRLANVRWGAAIGLGELGDPVGVDALITLLADRNRDVRRSAATALGKLKDKRAVPALSLALADPWEQVRQSAAAALRNLNAVPVADPLLTYFHDRLGNVDIAIIEALGQTGDPRVIPVLRAALPKYDRSREVLMLRVLAQLGDTSAVPDLLSLLESPNISKNIVLHLEIVKALGIIGDARALPALGQIRDTAKGPMTTHLRKATGEAIEAIWRK